MEVPLVDSDAVQWTAIPVPAHYASAGDAPCCPATQNVAGGQTLCEPTSSSPQPHHHNIIWRIHEESSRVLELMELSSHQDVHRKGLHLVFEDDLSPFACVIPSQGTGKAGYMVWVVTVGGVVYRLHVIAAGGSWMMCSDLQQHEVRSDVQRLHHVTAFAATSHHLCLGGHSGSIICVPFGTSLHSSGADLPFELKDADAGLSRLWGYAFSLSSVKAATELGYCLLVNARGFVLRGKNAGPIRSLAIRLLHNTPMVFVLHEDGTLRVWDLLHRNRLLHHSLSSSPQISDCEIKLMWVEEVESTTAAIQLAFLSVSSTPGNYYYLFFDTSSRRWRPPTWTAFSAACGLHRRGDWATSLSGKEILVIWWHEGIVIDLKLVQTGLWVLQSTSKGYELLFANFMKERDVKVCRMQENFVAEQLLQGPRHEWDDLLFIMHPVVGVSVEVTLSDVFLRRLLQPGVRQRAALKQALYQRGRPLSDSDLAFISLDALRSHITAAVESESCGDSRARVLHEWMNFCNDYLTAWTENSTPYGLVVDAKSSSVGLIRSSSLSVVRSLSGVEQLLPGGSQTTLPMEWKQDDADEGILVGELLNCADSIAEHLGQVALGVLYESLLRPLDHPVPVLVASLVRILDVGFSSMRINQETGYIGVDDVRAKEQEQHQRQRVFALHIAHSLQALQRKAGGWDRLLCVIEKYVCLLVLAVKPLTPATASAATRIVGSIPKKLLSQATSQIAWAHFQAAQNLLLLLSYVVKLRSQVGLSSIQVSGIQLHLIPQLQEAMTVSLLLHWLTVTFAEVPPPEDFSSQLSSLRLDGTSVKAGGGRVGAGEMTLSELLVSTFLEVTEVELSLSEAAIPDCNDLLSHAWQFVSWLLLGENGDYPLPFSGRAISLSNILLQYGQYSSLENFLVAVEQFSSQQKLAEGVRTVDGHWSARLHLLGFCLLARARTGLQNCAKEKRIGEAIRCFFRAASGLGEANEALQSLFLGTGYQQNLPGRGAGAAWRLHYFEWVMQIFEQYKLSEGACQFAHAALEQVDEAAGVSIIDSSEDTNPSTLSAAIKGRLWANVFKFSLDLDLYGDAYCAIISNPDEESKHICLRRFIVVLCERRATQVLCGNELPYAGLLEKVDQELLWKAENSDVSAKPSPYKLLYGLHMQRHNCRRAAGYMYRYSVRVREESRVPNLLEELRGVVAAINALQLVDPNYAWFDLPSRASEWPAPLKRQRLTTSADSDLKPFEKGDQKVRRVVDIEDLEKDYALTKAKMQLAHSDIKHPVIGGNATAEEVVWSLVQCRLYETAFSLIFLFWRESLLKRELERVMEVMARNCCLLQIQEATPKSLLTGGDVATRFLLTTGTLSEDAEESIEKGVEDETGPQLPPAGTARTAWQALQIYLDKYRTVHPRLPVVVAESILTMDRHMELPLWLVDIFKGGRDASALGMAGVGADPAALLRIYLDFDRLAEATSLVLEYIRAWTSLRPADVIKRKHMCAVWFPYTLLDRLQSCLSMSSDIGVCEKLLGSLKSALQSHFKQVKVDSNDVMS